MKFKCIKSPNTWELLVKLLFGGCKSEMAGEEKYPGMLGLSDNDYESLVTWL